jgi:hypothetical protein
MLSWQGWNEQPWSIYPRWPIWSHSLLEYGAIQLGSPFLSPPISVLGSSKIATIQLASGVLPWLAGMYHTMICIPQYLTSCHTTNILSSDTCTSWYYRNELNMLSHELPRELALEWASDWGCISASLTTMFRCHPRWNHWSCFLLWATVSPLASHLLEVVRIPHESRLSLVERHPLIRRNTFAHFQRVR